jgi:hypothetical protein
MKQVWVQPKLTILLRGNPEESVLSTCKRPDGLQTGPFTNTQKGCTKDGSGACQSRNPS